MTHVFPYEPENPESKAAAEAAALAVDALNTPQPWTMNPVINGEMDDFIEILGPTPKPLPGIHPTPAAPVIAHVFTGSADAIIIRAAPQFWDALNAIADAEGLTAGELRELARNAMGKR